MTVVRSWWCSCGYVVPRNAPLCFVCGAWGPVVVRIRYRRPLGMRWHVALPCLVDGRDKLWSGRPQAWRRDA